VTDRSTLSPARETEACVREARRDDVPAILGLIRELAEYERAAHEALATEEMLTEALFGPEPKVFALVIDAEGPQAAEHPLAGMALWFLNFSTWTGRHGIYLEDLYVRPQARGGGHGTALLRALARICVERGYTRLEWTVLDWNAPALRFYRSLSAVPMDEWTVHRVSGPALAELAGEGESRGVPAAAG
jgi:GNAT superfamily N-acetyltransferase